MILHSDGRIEGTPSEIAEYMKLKTGMVNPGVISKAELDKMKQETLIRLLKGPKYVTNESDWKKALERLDNTADTIVRYEDGTPVTEPHYGIVNGHRVSGS